MKSLAQKKTNSSNVKASLALVAPQPTLEDKIAKVYRSHRGGGVAQTVSAASDDLLLLVALLEHTPDVNAPPVAIRQLLEIVEVLEACAEELGVRNDGRATEGTR